MCKKIYKQSTFNDASFKGTGYIEQVCTYLYKLALNNRRNVLYIPSQRMPETAAKKNRLFN